MHHGMPYDPIQGQGQDHGNSEIPKNCTFLRLSQLFTMAGGK